MDERDEASRSTTPERSSGREGVSIYRQIMERVLTGDPSRGSGGQSGERAGVPGLEPGDWIEVCPVEAIRGTLDRWGRHRGLCFMPEMEQFCGRRFRVLKRVRTIKLESSGEVRRLKDPTVLLEGVYCDGGQHQGCDRACLHLWREAWLRRVPTPEAAQDPATVTRAPGPSLQGRAAPTVTVDR